MAEESSALTWDEIQLWNVAALKDFLRVRGLKFSGKRKDELRALVYSTVQFGVEEKPDEVEEDRRRSAHYAELLHVDNNLTLPDPLVDLTSGWVNEKEGVKQWPPVSYFEIADWLLNEVPCPSEPSCSKDKKPQKPASLHHRLLTDYKEGKAYSYFDSKWIQETLYKPISANSKICFLKASCTPSQSIKNIPHTVWTAVEKASGKICSAYCSCFAGLGSTCNHVAALVFKVDHAFMTGVSRRTKDLPCTSKVCTWNVYSGGAAAVLEAKPVCDMQWAKPSFNKGENKTPINTVAKRLFDPFQNTSHTPNQQGLLSALYPSCKDSTLFRYMFDDENISETPQYPPYADFNLAPTVEVETEAHPSTPLSLAELAAKTDTVDSFLESLSVLEASDIKAVEKEMRGQADNAQWAKFRSGMVTASNLKNVVTRNETLHDKTSSRSKDAQPIIKKIMGYDPLNPNLPSLKYGRLMEPIARKTYTTLMKEKGHRNVQVDECGLFVHPEKRFLGASPDALVKCSCCGEGVLEIKCPRSIAMEEPTSYNMSALKEIEGKPKLKENHTYFYQVQAQMGVTGRAWSDFFIYSKGGYHLERIRFQEGLWENAVTAAEQFFTEFIAPELIHCKIANSLSTTEAHSSTNVPSTSNSILPTNTAETRTSTNVPSTSNSVLPTNTAETRTSMNVPSTSNSVLPTITVEEPPASKKKGGKLKKKAKPKQTRGSLPVYMCDVCSQTCKYSPTLESENSIGCDNCSGWFHWAGEGMISVPRGNWLCSKCRSS